MRCGLDRKKYEIKFHIEIFKNKLKSFLIAINCQRVFARIWSTGIFPKAEKSSLYRE